MNNGAVAGFKYFTLEEIHNIKAEVRGSGNGHLEVFTDISKEPVAVLEITPSDRWKTFSKEIRGNLPETYALYFRYQGEGFIDFNVITKKSPSSYKKCKDGDEFAVEM